MGYLFSLILILFMLFPMIVLSADCSNDNLKTVEKCYKKMFEDFGFVGNIPDGDEFFNLYESQIKKMDGINKTCEASATLKDCLKADVIANCVNLNVFNKLDFVKGNPFWAQIYVTNFIEVDYSCGKGYEVLLDSFQCIIKFRGEWNTTNENNNDDGCKAYENDANPIIDAANKKCGKAAGCFVAKSSKINTCYYEEANCTFCGTLNINNLDYFDTLCTDDAPPPPPTKSTKVVEMTTKKNGSSPVATISIFLLLILSFVKFMVNYKFQGF